MPNIELAVELTRAHDGDEQSRDASRRRLECRVMRLEYKNETDSSNLYNLVLG